MPLDRIDQMLNNEAQAYLNTSLNYDILRSDCLAAEPVQPVIVPVITLLDTYAVEEKAQANISLTQQAHDRQIEQDASQEYSDTREVSTYKTEKENLQAKISSLRWEQVTVDALYLAYQISHSSAHCALQQAQSRLCDLESRIHNNYHYHGHPHEHESQHYHSFSTDPYLEIQLTQARYEVSRLQDKEREESCIFIGHQTRKSRIESEVYRCETRIDSIIVRENDLKKQKTERNQRHSVRTNHPNELRENALSSRNINQLKTDIQTQFNSINDTCQKMKNLAEERCYTVFLNQLELQLDTLLCLYSNEKTALKKIITTMNEYQLEVDFRLQQETELLRLEAALKFNWQTYTNKTAEYEALNNNNNNIINSNELLKSGLRPLETQYEKLLKLRNDYSIGTLAAIGLTGASTITAYFLIQAGLMSPVLGLIGTAVLGAAIIGLVITSSTFAIMAAFKNNEIHTCQQTILNNETISIQNDQTMAAYQEIELPNLSKHIYNLQEQVAEQATITDAARQKETLTFEKAEGIRVIGPGAGNNNSAFFQAASAPPMNEYTPSSTNLSGRLH